MILRYSHSQWLFYEFVSKITNKLVKQSLRVTVWEVVLFVHLKFTKAILQLKYHFDVRVVWKLSTCWSTWKVIKMYFKVKYWLIVKHVRKFTNCGFIWSHMKEFILSKCVPLQCQTCGKHFKLLVYLKSHISVHTGEIPLMCKTSEKTYKLWVLLKARKIHFLVFCHLCLLSQNEFFHIAK